MRIIAIVIGLILVLGLGYVLVGMQVYRSWAFVCQTTGSRKAYQVYFGFLKTPERKTETKLEALIKKASPGTFKNQWVSYAGTGYNIYGRAILFGHGRPGPIYFLSTDVVDAWVEKHTEQESLELYRFFQEESQKQNQDLMKKRVDSLNDWYVEGLDLGQSKSGKEKP